MLKSPLARSGLFLAISALLAPQWAVAQSADPDPAGDQPSQLDEVQVRGEYIPQPLLETAEVVSVLTKEDFQRTGDGNAAEALSRVSGLSLVGGKFVYVRGLGERYSAAVLNGSTLPSPEPLQRVVPLDLFPSSIVDNVVVQKTYSVRYPGEFGGGIIDLKTVSVPDEPFFSISIGTGGARGALQRDAAGGPGPADFGSVQRGDGTVEVVVTVDAQRRRRWPVARPHAQTPARRWRQATDRLAP